MPDLTFKQQIALAVIDKVLLGVAGALGVVATVRWIEWYKARQALIQATATTRLQKAEPLMQQFGEIESEFAWLRVRGWQRAKSSLAGYETFEETPNVRSYPEHENVIRQVVANMEAERMALVRQIGELTRAIAADRFWLGDSIVVRMTSRLQHLARELTAFEAVVLEVDRRGPWGEGAQKSPTVEDLINELSK